MELNTALRTALADDLAAYFTTATAKDDQGNTVAVFDLTDGWAAADAGAVALDAPVDEDAALRNHDFDAAPGTLVLSGGGTETLTLTLGGPDAETEANIANDADVPTGYVYQGKGVTLEQITLTVPSGA